MLVAGMAVTGYSLATLFGNVPAIISDWRVTFAIGVMLAFLGVLAYLFKRELSFYWAEPEVRCSAIIEERQDASLRTIKFACLEIYNNEGSAITDCCSTLVTATNYYGGDMTPIPHLKDERLQWMNAAFSSDDCKITIPPQKGEKVNIARASGGFSFSGCKTNRFGIDLQGLYTVRIRVDGKFQGKDMKPLFFDGYMYVANQIYSIDDAHQIWTNLIFEEGDWTKDKRIKLPKKVYDDQ